MCYATSRHWLHVSALQPYKINTKNAPPEEYPSKKRIIFCTLTVENVISRQIKKIPRRHPLFLCPIPKTGSPRTAMEINHGHPGCTAVTGAFTWKSEPPEWISACVLYFMDVPLLGAVHTLSMTSRNPDRRANSLWRWLPAGSWYVFDVVWERLRMMVRFRQKCRFRGCWITR